MSGNLFYSNQPIVFPGGVEVPGKLRVRPDVGTITLSFKPTNNAVEDLYRMLVWGGFDIQAYLHYVPVDRETNTKNFRLS